jgi:peptidoglycan L-alanyl-D-glutamate endopeptidase CwlK
VTQDEKSSAVLASVRPELRKVAEYVQKYVGDNHSIRLIWVQGLRTEEEQAKLYAQGRTAPGPIVTQAESAATSPHGRGAALDFAVLDQLRRPTWDYGAVGMYNVVGNIAKTQGLVWGGDFRHPDRPHIELASWKELPFPWSP